ncbi:winged helix-turn-helix transcriptional regulator [Spirillospora sp. CA-142024]|uniref:winged helix-turn-helix transcriptional regulator n=1 Tax=Spirillospora sp. CA-142024 TaxID=3240036 RepID=UPI003D8F6230
MFDGLIFPTRRRVFSRARYGQLQTGLPGITIYLPVERLRELERSGVVRRRLDTDGNSLRQRRCGRSGMCRGCRTRRRTRHQGSWTPEVGRLTLSRELGSSVTSRTVHTTQRSDPRLSPR